MKDERNAIVKGDVILSRDIYPRIATMVSSLKSHHGTSGFIRKSVCTETSNAWRTLRDDVYAMLAAAKESRENPDKRLMLGPARPVSALLKRTSVGGNNAADGSSTCKLKQLFTFEHKVIQSYRLDIDTAELVPTHAFPDKKTIVKVYSGDFRGLVKAEGENFTVHVAYTDPPWNIHPGRVEDEKVLTPQQVTKFHQYLLFLISMMFLMRKYFCVFLSSMTFTRRWRTLTRPICGRPS